MFPFFTLGSNIYQLNDYSFDKIPQHYFQYLEGYSHDIDLQILSKANWDNNLRNQQSIVEGYWVKYIIINNSDFTDVGFFFNYNTEKKIVVDNSFGIKEYKLTNEEKSLFKKSKPWGVILFSRNIKNISQLKKLVSDIKEIFKDDKYPILIDQEGGKVSRFSNLFNSKEFSQNFFGNLFEKDKRNGKVIYQYYLNSICSVLKNVGDRKSTRLNSSHW